MLCIPIIAKNSDEAIKKMATAENRSDMFEIRLDLMDTFDLAKIIQSSDIPKIVTYRSVAEGGKGDAGHEVSAGFLINAIQEGANLVDVELSMSPKWRDHILNKRGNTKIVISTHINDRTPSHHSLKKLFDESVIIGADVVKIITWAEKWENNLNVLELIPMAKSQGVEIITFCMGPIGRISRVLSLLMGGYLSFTSLESGQESAAGQIPLKEMKKLLEYFQP